LHTSLGSAVLMDIFCPSCQTKLQIADSHAGQTVKCPSCAASFQAPSLPSTAPLPAPEPLAPRGPEATYVPTPDTVHAAATASQGPVPAPQNQPVREHSKTVTMHLRHEVVSMIVPIGIFILFFLSFFPWRPAADWTTLDRFTEWTTLNLWQLA